MKLRSWILATAACAAGLALAGPPPAGVWNIAATGRAASSGDLHFRITHNDGSDPVDITVPVLMGAKEEAIARSIRNSLGTQLRRDRFKVELGEGANVLVSDSRGRPNFALELIDSDIENLRVAVQSVTPAASPTVPTQEVPAVPPVNPPPINSTTEAPGAATPVPDAQTPLPGSGLGIPDNAEPRVPNTSPPANVPSPPPAPPPATPPASPPPAPPPMSQPPATPPPTG
jgi:hypothetical protein